MLLNTELKISVTNDGKENKTEVTANINQSYKEVLVAIKLAEKMYTEMFLNFLREKGVENKEEALKLYNEIKLEELYGE